MDIPALSMMNRGLRRESGIKLHLAGCNREVVLTWIVLNGRDDTEGVVASLFLRSVWRLCPSLYAL
jgi:hypothetical protein